MPIPSSALNLSGFFSWWAWGLIGAWWLIVPGALRIWVKAITESQFGFLPWRRRMYWRIAGLILGVIFLGVVAGVFVSFIPWCPANSFARAIVGGWLNPGFAFARLIAPEGVCGGI